MMRSAMIYDTYVYTQNLMQYTCILPPPVRKTLASKAWAGQRASAYVKVSATAGVELGRS